MMQDQAHKATKCNVVFAGLAKYPVPGQKNIKGSRREFHQKRNSNACINAKVEGVGTPGICGALSFDLYCSLHPREFD